VDAQDIHQTIVLGLACVIGTVSHADSTVWLIRSWNLLRFSAKSD